jgi:hypothetical protein
VDPSAKTHKTESCVGGFSTTKTQKNPVLNHFPRQDGMVKNIFVDVHYWSHKHGSALSADYMFSIIILECLVAENLNTILDIASVKKMKSCIKEPLLEIYKARMVHVTQVKGFF